MAFSFLIAQSAASTGASTGATTAAINTTGANLLVINAGFNNTVTVAISDSKGNTWTPLTSRGDGTNFDPGEQVFYAINPTVGAGHTFSISGANSFGGIAVAAFSGTAAFEAEIGTTGNSGTAQAGSLTPAQNNELVIAGLSLGAVTVNSIDSGFTIPTNGFIGFVNGQTYGTYIAYLIQTAPAAENPSWTLSSANLWAAELVTFKQPATTISLPSVTGMFVLP